MSRNIRRQVFIFYTEAQMKVRIQENSWLAKIAAYKLKTDQVALTLGHTIHLHHTTRAEFLNDKDWVCHELRHVAQFRQYGLIAFTFRYLAESLRRGYYQNRWEVEARLAEKDHHLLEGVIFY